MPLASIVDLKQADSCQGEDLSVEGRSGSHTLKCLEFNQLGNDASLAIALLARYGYINGSSALANCSIAERAHMLQEANVRKLSSSH